MLSVFWSVLSFHLQNDFLTELQLISKLIDSEKVSSVMLIKFILRELVSCYSEVCGKSLRLGKFKCSLQVCIKSN